MDRPVWSVMIPVYNCGQFLQETLESVLIQHIPECDMQIEVLDDASTDIDVEALVRKTGKGRIKYFRQQQNVGSLRNFETCINRAMGRLVHILHGDDKVRYGYYRKIESLLKQYPQAGAAYCRYSTIDEAGKQLSEIPSEMPLEGILKNWLLKIGERQRIQYAAITVRREVYEKLGSFYGLEYGEDWEMWVRIAKYYPVAYSPGILAEYRTHSASISSNKFLSAAHLQDLYKAMSLIQHHLPEDRRKGILKKSRRYYASYGLTVAYRLWQKLGNRQVVYTQISQVLKLYKSPMLYLMIIKLHLKLTFQRL